MCCWAVRAATYELWRCWMQMGSPPRVQGLPPTYRCSLIKVGCPAASAVLPCCSSAGVLSSAGVEASKTCVLCVGAASDWDLLAELVATCNG